MRLTELAAEVPGAVVVAGGEADVQRVVHDSWQATAGDLFVAVRGLRADGHDYVAEVVQRGAAVAVETDVALPPGAAQLRVPSTRAALGELAAALFGRPARRLLVAGITGTDGKTTTTHMARHVLAAAGAKVAALSTVAIETGSSQRPNESGLTTVDAVEVQRWLADAVAAGAEHAILEVTSHALVQERVAACDFDVAAITNVGRDHLDYHPTWEDYLEAKARLIALCAAAPRKSIAKTAVLNQDDASYALLKSRPIERRLACSLENRADVSALGLRPSARGTAFSLGYAGRAAPVDLAMQGAFNVADALLAAAVCLALGLDLESIAAGLTSFPGLAGRLERVDAGQPFEVYIDFAHAAGSLASVLAALQPRVRGRLIAVFGSTGRSDHDRPGMGRAAAAGADYFVITTDDPVKEDPAEIARQVESGAAGRRRGSDYDVVLDRREAIRRALQVAGVGDVVLFAGKGHERFMLTARGHEPWDERAEIEAALRELSR